MRSRFDIDIAYDKQKKGYYIDETCSLDLPQLFSFLELTEQAGLKLCCFEDKRELLQYISLEERGGEKELALIAPLIKAMHHSLIVTFDYVDSTKAAEKENTEREVSLSYALEPYLIKEAVENFILSD